MADFRTREEHIMVLPIGSGVEVPLEANLGQNAEQFIGSDNPNGNAGQVAWRIKGQNDIAIQNQGRVEETTTRRGAAPTRSRTTIPPLQSSDVTGENGFASVARDYLIRTNQIDSSTSVEDIERAILQRQRRTETSPFPSFLNVPENTARNATYDPSPLSQLQSTTDNIINEGLSRDERSRMLDGVEDNSRFPEPDSEESSPATAAAESVSTAASSLGDAFRANTPVSQNFDNLYYPEGMDQLNQDYIKFESFRYESNLSSANDIRYNGLGQLGGARRRDLPNSGGQSDGTVILPISSMIRDSNNVSWGPDELNPLQAGVFKLGYDMIKGDITKAMGDLGTKLREALSQEGVRSELKDAAAVYFASRAAGVGNQLSRAKGAVLNPNLTLLFNNPSLRSFQFSFNMSAREQSEATMIKSIIQFFKKTSSVRISTSNLFLLAPNVYTIKYCVAGGGEQKSIGKVKTCALLGCDIDYTPDGSYMTFDDADKTMTSYRMTLRFQETDPVYYDDYNSNDLGDNKIGY